MSIDSNALNIGQYALLSNDPLVQAVTMSLIDNGSVMADIPFVNKASLLANGVRWEGNLPTVNWTNINEEGVTTTGTPTPYQEQAFILRNNIDTDKVLVQDTNQIVDPRAAMVDAYMKAASYDFNHKFIKNDHITGDKKAVVGIRARIDNGAAYGVRSENKIDAGNLDLSQAGATAAKANLFLELLDQLLWSVDSPSGEGVTLYMNEVTRRRINFLARLLGPNGGFDTARDMYDRVIMTYKGALLRDIGYKADQATRIITVTEDTSGNDASSNCTSIYAVNYGTTHFFGWQFAPLHAEDLGRLNNGVIYRTFIDWTGGLMNASNRSLGRIFGLKVS